MVPRRAAVVVGLIVLFQGGASRVLAKDAPIDFALDGATSFIWRGFNVPSASNAISFQPNLRWKVSPRWSVNASGSLRMQNTVTWDLLQYGVEYQRPLALSAQLTAGYHHYGFGGAVQPTLNGQSADEAYAGVGWPKLPFSPTVTGYYGGVKGNYAEFSAIQNLKVLKLPIRMGTSFGYNNGQFVSGSAFNNIGFNVEADFPMGGGWAIAPRMTYLFPKRGGTAAVNPNNEWFLSWGIRRTSE